MNRKILKFTALTGGEAKVVQTTAGIEVSVPAANRDALDTIVKLELDGPAPAAAIQPPPP